MADKNIDRVKNLFAYLAELSNLKKKPVTSFRNHCDYIKIDSNITNNRFIALYQRNEETAGEEGSPILTVRFPSNTPKPQAPSALRRYLDQGAQLEGRSLFFEDRPVDLTDNPGSQAELDLWVQDIAIWEKLREEEKTARALFDKLMNIRRQFQRDVEPLEFVAANISIAAPAERSVDHPVFVKRVEVDYDDEANAMVVLDTADPAGIYSAHLGTIREIDLSELNRFEAEVSDPAFHPFDSIRSQEMATRFLHSCSPSACFSEKALTPEEAKGIPLYGRPSPMLILRRKPDGIGALANRIKESVVNIDNIPEHLLHLIGITHERMEPEERELTVEQRLAHVGGEDPDILLAKLANGEQLDIAREIERHSAVIVQGPPGTGKTHTIANLVGHFLSQGKTVLVTSEKNKALSVLKDKIDPQIQPLCVSLVGNSTADLRRSVEEISASFSRGITRQRANARRLEDEREEVIESLGDIRRALFTSLDAEQTPIVIDGEEYFPIDAARFVEDHRQLLDIFGFAPETDDRYPFAENEIETLYRLNAGFDEEFISMADPGIPNPESLLSPRTFSGHVAQSENSWRSLEELLDDSSVNAVTDLSGRLVSFSFEGGITPISEASDDELGEFIVSVDSLSVDRPWERALVIAGTDDVTTARWSMLFEAADKAFDLQTGNLDALTAHTVGVSEGLDPTFARTVLDEVRDDIALSGIKLKLKRLRDKEAWNRREQVLSALSVDGRPIGTPEAVDVAKIHLELKSANGRVAMLWDNLTAELGVTDIPALDRNRPDRTVRNHREQIEILLQWEREDLPALVNQAAALGLPIRSMVGDRLDGDIGTSLDKVVAYLKGPIRTMAAASVTAHVLRRHESAISELLATLDQLPANRIIRELTDAAEQRDTPAYESGFRELEAAYRRLGDWRTYQGILSHVEIAAPSLAERIRRKAAPHDTAKPPAGIELAWKAGRLLTALERIDSVPYADLQEKGAALSARYRELTASLAGTRAWIALHDRIAGNSAHQQALTGWAQMMKKRGKGTGKRAAEYERQARALMSKCQNAVPAWIMNIGQAASMFDPSQARFDVVIVDEASQSDVTSLVMTYLGEKVIIVGDDEQVSPTPIGVESDRLKLLQRQYLEDAVENSQLYGLEDSLYDIAKTTFTQLMLREHFRCVPQIIGFSNGLSYDFSIKPLREKNDTQLLPATVCHRVEDGERLDKVNRREAEEVATLIRACIDNPAYDGKTFGAISMLGDDQVKLLQATIDRACTRREMEERKILVGNAADFQGDERDVIFLSLVDSSTGDGPLPLKGDGSRDVYKKRYNVAVSRAKDQLWVVHSLDPSSDLKPRDLRRRLIEYAADPDAAEQKLEEIAAKSDSPFEEEVARALVTQGFAIEQQYEVGAYRIDMAVLGAHGKIAIECDGERWHSGAEKIHEDLERQTILERLGWRFVRIRGSEYYRDKKRTLERVVKQLDSLGVNRDRDVEGEKSPMRQGSELLDQVLAASRLYLERGTTELGSEERAAAVSFALRGASAHAPQPKSLSQDKGAERAAPKLHETATGPGSPDKRYNVKTGSAPKRGERKPNKAGTSGTAKKRSRANTDEVPSSIWLEKPVDSADSGRPDPKPMPARAAADKRTGQESNEGSDWLVTELAARGLEYRDMRDRGGCLWVKGGKLLKPAMKGLEDMGAVFTMKKEGCRVFKGEAAWWLKGYPDKR